MPPSPVSSSVPLTQNTAPILEFRCLFTPDFKKKAKKWQDGRLKFHTFNKRIMVYDDRTNYVGDTHYHTHTLEEGEELELERGVLVEVGELIGKQDQDLEEVLDAVRGAGKSARQQSAAPPRVAGRGATPGPSAGRYATPAPAARQMSMMSTGPVRPLSALLGTPQGRYGRALLPTTSPFEDRQNAIRIASETPEPASKRRKVDSMPTAQPMWVSTSLVQSGLRNPPPTPIARELSYPDSVAPKARAKKTFEKSAKLGYAQKLTGAVLDLSSTQKTNVYNGHQASIHQTSPADDSDEDMTITGSRDRATIPAPILPPVKRKPGAVLPPKKPTEIVYPDSIAPRRKERMTFEKSSKAGYAEKLTGAALDLSSSNMANVHKRLQPSTRAPSTDAWSDDDEMLITDLQERPRVETPIRPPPPSRKPAPILPPKAAPREIVYPESIVQKVKPKRTYEKKSKAGYAEKLTGAALNLLGTPAAFMKRSQPTGEEEDLLARLAELRAEREAAERGDADEEQEEVTVPKPKKARTSKAKGKQAEAAHVSGKENQGSLFVEDDFMDIDTIAPLPDVGKVGKPKKPRAPRKNKKTDDAELETSKKPAPILPTATSIATSIAIRNASEEEKHGSGSSRDNTRPSDATPDAAETSQTSVSGISGALRIKTKPRRQMLMMQALPLKHAAPSTALAPEPPAILPGASLAAKRQAAPEPSQATKTLTDFHEKQKEKLEERRRKIEARKKILIEIHSSPEPEAQADEAMDIPSSPINLDEEEWVNPNAIISNGMADSETMSKNVAAAAVRPTPNQQPSATPLSPHTTNRSKPFAIREQEHHAEDESEESAITYTDIDKSLRPQRSPFSRTATAPAGLVEPPAQNESITPPPQPSLPQSSPAFTQQKERAKRPLPTFPSASKKSQSLEAAKSSLRRPPVPLFNSTQNEEPQSSMFVRQDTPNKGDADLAEAESAQSLGYSDEDDPPQPIRAARRVRKVQPVLEVPEAQLSRQSSPDWPSDDSGSETEEPSSKRQTRARPVVDSSDIMSCPESQAEEAGFDSSPPPRRGRELSAADKERLANGHSVLVKLKSGIRSKEIIRPKSVNQVRTGDANVFVGFMRPPLPIIRSLTGRFVMPEEEEGPESEGGVDDDEVMRDLERQDEEERKKQKRLEEAQRRTREFRAKKERERLAMEGARRAEEERLADKLREEDEERKMEEKHKLKEQQREAQQLLEQQEKERLEVEEKKLTDKLRREVEERQREEKRWVEQQLMREAEEKAQQERLNLEAKQEADKLEQKRKEEEKVKVRADNERKAKLANEARQKWEEEQKRLQKEKDDLEAREKLEEQAKYDEMKQRIEKDLQAKMDAQLKAMQEELRLSNQRLADQQERERLEKERQENTKHQRLEDLRIKEQNEAHQRELDAKKAEEQAGLLEKQKSEAEQLKRTEETEILRQQTAVEAAATKLASSASSLPRSLPRAIQGFRADEALAEKEKISKQAEYQRRVNTSFGKSFGALNHTATSIEHIDISAGGSFGEGDLIMAAPKVSAFKMPAPRSQAALPPQTPKPTMPPPTRSFNGFPTPLHSAMYSNGITTSTNDFAPTLQSTPPAVGYKVPSTLHLSAPSFKPFCKPKSVPIVPKKASKTMKEIRDEKNAERENREDLKRIPGWENKGDVLTWGTGAWTAEAGDLFGWRPKVGDFDED